jgi:hypothetical protein
VRAAAAGTCGSGLPAIGTTRQGRPEAKRPAGSGRERILAIDVVGGLLHGDAPVAWEILGEQLDSERVSRLVRVGPVPALRAMTLPLFFRLRDPTIQTSAPHLALAMTDGNYSGLSWPKVSGVSQWVSGGYIPRRRRARIGRWSKRSGRHCAPIEPPRRSRWPRPVSSTVVRPGRSRSAGALTLPLPWRAARPGTGPWPPE